MIKDATVSLLLIHKYENVYEVENVDEIEYVYLYVIMLKTKIKLIYVTVPPLPCPYVIIMVSKYLRIYQKYKCIGIRFKCY
jgi:hypothetical protein